MWVKYECHMKILGMSELHLAGTIILVKGTTERVCGTSVPLKVELCD